MSERICWIIIKGGCDAAQVDNLAAFQAQQNALWYEEQRAEYGPPVTPEEQTQVAILAGEIAKASERQKKKAQELEAVLRGGE